MNWLNRTTVTPEQDLLNAVVVQAAQDHRSAFMKLYRDPDDRQARKEKEETESFFLSEKFEVYTRVAGSYLLRKLREEEEEIVRDHEKFQMLVPELCSVWKRNLSGGEEEDLRSAAKIRKAIESILESVPEYAASLFILGKEEKKIMKEIKIREEKLDDC